MNGKWPATCMIVCAFEVFIAFLSIVTKQFQVLSNIMIDNAYDYF